MKSKNKLTINALAGSNLKMRKKQYALMITGILLAMIFSSGMLFFASSYLSSKLEAAKNRLGAQDFIFTNISEDIMTDAKENSGLLEYGAAHILGRVSTDNAEAAGFFDDKAYVGYLDDTAMRLSNISFIEGRYPENDGEIALESASYQRLNLKAKVGDKITLNVYPQMGKTTSDKFIKKEYTLVGIATNKLTNLTGTFGSAWKFEIPSAFVAQSTQTEVGGKEALTFYCSVSSMDSRLNKTRDYIFQNHDFDYEYEDYIIDSYKTYSGIGKELNGSFALEFGIFFILILLLISCLGIINAFSNNLNERKKQIGMLKTLGATTRQIINIYGREAFFITLICVPFSVTGSYFISKFVFKIIDKEIEFVPNIAVMIACAVFSIICVMLAALIPLIKASKISPIQSIRNIEISRKVKKKKIKSQKQFSMPKLLAKRNLNFYRGRQITVCIILIATILFSCYGFSFVDYVIDENWQPPFDYYMQSNSHNNWDMFNLKSKNSGYTNDEKNELLNIPYIENVTSEKDIAAVLEFDKYTPFLKYSYLRNFNTESLYTPGLNITPENFDELITKAGDSYLEDKDYFSLENEYANITISSVEDNNLKLLKNGDIDGEINISKINSGEEVIIYTSKYLVVDYDTEIGGIGTQRGNDLDEAISNYKNRKGEIIVETAECDFKPGDEITYTVINGDKIIGDESKPRNFEKKQYTAKIGAIVYGLPNEFANRYDIHSYDINIITTHTRMNEYFPNQKYSYLNMKLATAANDDIDREIMDVVDSISERHAEDYTFSNYQFIKNQQRERFAIIVSLISALILFLSVSGSVINNSLTGQIRDGKRKIGTLRAVGASHSDMVKSYIYQLLNIFGLSYGIGFGTFGVTYLGAYLFSKWKGTGFSLNFNIWQTAAACLILFIVCSINLWIRLKQETKNSIIDNIREL